MTVSEYKVRFSDLARHAPALVPTVRERVHRFIKGLHPSIRISIAQYLERDISYQQEREEREAKRSRETGFYTGTHAPAAVRHGGGYVSCLFIQNFHPPVALRAPPGPQAMITAPSTTPPTQPTRGGGRGVESVIVVRDYPDIFLDDLPGMPPDRDINFGINLLSGTQPISIPPYRMTPPELKEMKEQL
uniref:Uncharacterized protein LOC104247494 n=1 Tax=Nicotiana sylvestris TaxID=4096 RepID=A0A1U7YCH0_NICSY|nr:PREDICTED: uncharacterized protein LOC104247494 [Nicotiana sylvestris]